MYIVFLCNVWYCSAVVGIYDRVEPCKALAFEWTRRLNLFDENTEAQRVVNDRAVCSK